MSGTNFTLVESPSGIGELRRAGKRLAKVFYYLEVRREAGAAGPVDISGELTVSQDEPMQASIVSGLRSGEVLSLVLDDGRQLEFHATQGSPMEKQYHITGANPAGFISK
jgi:hypothetical protein